MHIQIIKEVTISEAEKGFEVLIFDNSKGGKDHPIKLSRSIDKVFNRFIRGGGFLTYEEGRETPIEYIRCHNTPIDICGYQISDVKVSLMQSEDGYRGTIKGVLRPFGPQWEQVYKIIKSNQNPMRFKLNCIIDKDEKVYQVTHAHCLKERCVMA